MATDNTKASPDAAPRPGWRKRRGGLEALLARHWWRARPSVLSRLLQPLSWLYGALTAAHRHIAGEPKRQPVPVLVVGNLVVGGAGKTPTVIALVQALQRAGWHPGIVSRGFGRRSDALLDVRPDSSAAEVGDEPLLMRRRTGVPVWVGRWRSQVAAALCAAHPEVDVLVADDGLQHHALARDVEVLVFDDRGAGNSLLLPAGPLREPLPAVLTTKVGGAVPRLVLYTGRRASTPLPGALAKHAPPAGVLPLPAWWAGESAAARPVGSLRDRPLLALAGLGAPEKFFAPLRAAGLQITPLPQPDHADYERLPWPTGTAEVITTEKDAVKLDPARCGATQVWVLPLDFLLPQDFVDAVLTALSKAADARAATTIVHGP